MIMPGLENVAASPSARPIIEVYGLRKAYGSVVAVEDVSLAVEEGEIFGILGPNGAGKTTTVECVSGLRDRDGGTSASSALIRNEIAPPCENASACSCRRAAFGRNSRWPKP